MRLLIDYPLKQGLKRHVARPLSPQPLLLIDYPLKQGLKRNENNTPPQQPEASY